jgi:hypothetical protein
MRFRAKNKRIKICLVINAYAQYFAESNAGSISLVSQWSSQLGDQKINNSLTFIHWPFTVVFQIGFDEFEDLKIELICCNSQQTCRILQFHTYKQFCCWRMNKHIDG